MANKKDGRVIARANEIRVLRALQRFGWLRTRDLASLCWTRWATKAADAVNIAPVDAAASAIRMAQRTLKRLALKRCVLSSQAPDGSIVYTLAEAGARTLSDMGLQAHSGKDLTRSFSSAFFRHRCIANEIAISAITQGFRVSTEREISQGLWLGGAHGVEGKRPDVVIRDGHNVIFCEVEKSRKNSADYQALLSWLGKMLEAHCKGGALIGNEKLLMQKVIFVCASKFRAKLQKDLLARGWGVNQLDVLINYSNELYSFRDIIFP